MIVVFDKRGVVKEQLMDYGNAPRVGSQTFQIFAYFNEVNLANYDIAYIKLQRPDLGDSDYPVLFMTKADLTFDSTKTNSHSNYFENGEEYPGFLFDFSKIVDVENNGSVVTLLDTPGLWKATITLVSSKKVANVVGVVTFEVGGVSAPEEPTYVGIDTVMNNFALAMINSYVPYTGATKDVDLGEHGFIAKNVQIRNELNDDFLSMELLGNYIIFWDDGETHETLVHFPITGSDEDVAYQSWIEDKMSEAFREVSERFFPNSDLTFVSVQYIPASLLEDICKKSICLVKKEESSGFERTRKYFITHTDLSYRDEQLENIEICYSSGSFTYRISWNAQSSHEVQIEKI